MIDVAETTLSAAASRRRGLTMAGAGRHLFFFGTAVHYLGHCVHEFARDVAELRHVTFAGAAMLIAGSILLILGRPPKWLPSYVVLLLGWIVFIGAAGWFGGNWSSYWSYDLVALGMFASIPVGGVPGMIQRTAKLYRVLLLPGLMVATWSFSQYKPATLGIRFDTETQFDPKIMVNLCAPALFLLLVSDKLSKLDRILCIYGVAMLVGYGVFTATRTEVVVASVAITSGAILGRRAGYGFVTIVFAAAAMMMVSVYQYGTDRMTEAVVNLSTRFARDDEATLARSYEAEGFYSSTSEKDWIVGRGLGGALRGGYFEVDNEYGMSMVHMGHLHLILKGGLVLLVLAVVTTLAAVVAGVRRRGTTAAGCVAFILAYVAACAGHQQFMINVMMAVFALCVGGALAPATATRNSDNL